MAKTILVTGASSGIGRATAELFHRRGWNVAATMRTPAAEQEMNHLRDVLVTRLDVTDYSSIEHAIDETNDRFGPIDVVVNNAGYGAYGPLEAFSMEGIERQFKTNVLGLLATIKAVLPQFRASKSGVIVNISSVGGKVGLPLGTLYHGTKFAVEGISEALHYELSAIGIGVKVIEPGVVATDFAGRSFHLANDESLLEYQPAIQSTLRSFAESFAAPSAPTAVAEKIFTAATDGTEQLRYSVGDDARDLINARSATDDADLFYRIRTQFSI